MIIGERIKKARKKINLNQTELGNLIGVTKVSICGYEKGNRIPNLENVEALADALKVSVDYLLGRDNEVAIVEDNEVKYVASLAVEDLQIINSIKKDKVLYNTIVSEPDRKIELISRRIGRL